MIYASAQVYDLFIKMKITLIKSCDFLVFRILYFLGQIDTFYFGSSFAGTKYSLMLLPRLFRLSSVTEKSKGKIIELLVRLEKYLHLRSSIFLR